MGLAACSDALECADKVAAIRAAGALSADYVLVLDEELGSSLLGSGATYAGRYVDGMCTGRLWHASELTRAGDTVRVETRTIPLADALSLTGTCTSGSPAQLASEAQGRACAALRAIAGTKTGALGGGGASKTTPSPEGWPIDRGGRDLAFGPGSSA